MLHGPRRPVLGSSEIDAAACPSELEAAPGKAGRPCRWRQHAVTPRAGTPARSGGRLRRIGDLP